MLFLPCLECQRVLLGSFNNYLGLIPTTQDSNHSGVCTFHWNAENLQFGNNQKGNSIGAAATWVSHMKTANFPIRNRHVMSLGPCQWSFCHNCGKLPKRDCMVFFWLLYSLDDRSVDPEADGDKEERQDDVRSCCDDTEISRESTAITVG